MTALPVEGENELNNNSINNNKENEIDNSTLEQNPGEHKNDELVEFLEDHELLDMKSEILSSKLKLSHFREVEKADLDDLCDDLELKPSQKIRLKHAIKTLQRSMVRNRIKEKMKSSVLSSKNKMINLKNKRLSMKAIKSNMSSIGVGVDNIFGSNNNNIDDDDQDEKKEEDNLRKLRSKIVIVGQAAVGKTTLQKAMMGWEFEAGSKATFAVNSSHHKSSYKHQQYDIMVDYEIFDTPGLDRFADIITLYLRGALAVIVVYDVCNYKSFTKAKWWINYLENNASGYDKIILIANKIDIKDDDIEAQPGSDHDDDDMSTSGKDDDDDGYDIIKQGRLYATEHGISFLEISAKTKDNVAVLLSWLNKQSEKKVANNPQLIEKKDQAIQLHEGLLNNNGRGNKFLDKLDNFDFDYSKCCAF
eukprot:CAMPEP_0201575270 /NCGR_PEP_ID=MMETSP0190_2-20130828/20371_1 /ASSEMBLY_ACC=CAM_ASM_000263 /TAXON_ID=37353 /ORGANISM="Rosalina sp." /LENGTH=418 /DNA_ID=CAMNT_0048004687 /DNA_START=50 /DNA_END=1306 /DNA_ORIENTATION=+